MRSSDFTAADAVRMSEECGRPDPEIVANLVDFVIRRIQQACTTGERRILNPFHGLRLACKQSEKAEAFRILQERGFNVHATGEITW